MVWFSHPFSLAGSSFSFSHLCGWAFVPGSILNLLFSLYLLYCENALNLPLSSLDVSHKPASHSPQLARHHHPEDSLPPVNMSETESVFPFYNRLPSSWLLSFCQHYLNSPMFLCHFTILIINLPLGFLKTFSPSDFLTPLTCFHCQLHPSQDPSTKSAAFSHPRIIGASQDFVLISIPKDKDCLTPFSFHPPHVLLSLTS